MTYLLFAALFLASFALVARPFLARRALAWPVEHPDQRDDVARAVSGLRDLEFARAAGTITAEDHARLAGLLERSAFVRRGPERATPAPWRTFVIAALLAGTAAVLVVVSLPQEAGDRAPGEPLTGSVPSAGPSITQLEARASAAPSDIPTHLALADAYLADDRLNDASVTYRHVLDLDRDNLAALNGLAIVLYRAEQYDTALLALDRVLTLNAKDPDALFLKGLIQYRREDWKGAADTWRVFLDVGEFDGRAQMVRPLYDDAVRRAQG